MVLQRIVSGTASSVVGRNDPCPCGSGRKYKSCCLGKAAPARPAIAAGSLAELDRVASLRDAGRLLEAAKLARDYVARHVGEPQGHAALGMVHLYAGRAAEALPCLMEAVRLAPSIAQNHYNAGWALEQLGRDGEAITALRQAVAIDPHDAQALERLGLLLLTYDVRDQALDCFRRVVAIEPDSVMGRLSHARLLFEEGQRAEGEALVHQTAALHPASPEVKRALASILRERGEFEQAIPLLEQATEGSPLQAANAYFDLAMSQRITDDDQPMLQQMQGLLDYRSLSDAGRQRVHFGLGKAYDDLRDPETAMRHFDAANRLAGQNRPFDRSHLGASAFRLMSTATREFFDAHRGLGSASELPVLVLGMPRSGTTLVEQIVSSHPDVAGGDELTYWNRAAGQLARGGPNGLTPELIANLAAEYERVLRRISPTAIRVTDKMPGNFLWIGLFHLAFPHGRIIHCRRHPLDTCLSNYFTNFTSPIPFTNDKGHLTFYYRWYRRLMAHWRDVLPPGVMLEVDYEELVADPEPMTRRMVGFLGLEWTDACLRPEDNRRAVKTASMWQARQPIYRSSTERWRRYEPWLGELRDLLDDPDGSALPQPESDNAKITVAARLREAGRYDEAIAVLQEALRASPNDPVLYSDVGSVCLLSNRVELAVDCFERAIGLNPNFAVAHYNLGAALERQGRVHEAIAAHRRAIALSPTIGGAFSRLGNLLQALGEQRQAVECFRRAKELLVNPSDQDLEEAKLLLVDERYTDAEPKLRSVIAAAPGNSLAHALLGDVLGQLGQFDDAVSMLHRATELDPERVGAWHNLVVLTKIFDEDRAVVEHLEGMLEQPGRSEDDRIMLHFALGKARDDLGEYQRAIEHYDQANALEHRCHTFHRDALAAQVDQLIATPSIPVSSAASDLPLLIIGMPRSGTTLVEQIVSAHPATVAGGELTYWSEHPNGSAEEYLALLRRIAPEAARVTDKNPFNFLEVGRIHEALPNARFIHCERDPVDTCLSIYFTRFASQQPFAYDRADLVFYFRQYLRLMAHWRSALPADRFLEIDYQALTGEPEPLTRRIVEFCGLEWNSACLAPERNQRVVRTASIWQARQPIYRTSVERWRNYEPWLGELAELRSGAK